MSHRALLMLGGLALAAVLLAAIASVVVPPEWSDPLPVPALRLAPGPFGSPPGVGDVLTPTPGPALTPGPGGTRPVSRDTRDSRRLWFGLGDAQGVSGFGGRIASLLLLLAGGVFLLLLMPARLGRIAQAAAGGGASLLRLGLVGLAGFILLGALGVLSVVALAGAPGWLFLALAVYAGALTGLAALCLPLGRWVSRRWGLPPQSPLVDLLAGLLLVAVLSQIPVLATLALAVLLTVGFGAVLQTRVGSRGGWDRSALELEY